MNIARAPAHTLVPDHELRSMKVNDKLVLYCFATSGATIPSSSVWVRFSSGSDGLASTAPRRRISVSIASALSTPILPLAEVELPGLCWSCWSMQEVFHCWILLCNQLGSGAGLTSRNGLAVAQLWHKLTFKYDTVFTRRYSWLSSTR